MAYSKLKELPKGVKNSLPEHAQEIYRKAFNNAYQEYKENEDREQTAHQVAWAAVKQRYEKKEKGGWRSKDD